MPSLMELLLDTLPLAAVEATLKRNREGQAHPIALEKATGKDLKPHLRFIPKGTPPAELSPLEPPKPSWLAKELAKKIDELPVLTGSLFHESQNIWGFDLGASFLSSLNRITCRASGDDYGRYLVLESLYFGHQEGPGAWLYDSIKAVDTNGQTIMLPLTDDFLRFTWLTHDTELDGKHALWNVPSAHDVGLLRVFVYELWGSDAKPRPLAGETAEEQAAFDAVLAACSRIGPGMDDGDRSASQLFGDATFFPEGLSRDVDAAIGESTRMKTRPTRIVVALSCTMCKWRADVMPGWALGSAHDSSSDVVPTTIAAGRMYPNVMIIANAPFLGFEASIQFQRPRATTRLESQPNSAEDELDKEIRPVLTAEANLPDLLYRSAPVPLWSNLFTYFEVDVPPPGTRLRMVRTDKNGLSPRAASNVIRRHADNAVPGGKSTVSTLHKVPRQGDFDSIYMGPSMKALSVAAISSGPAPIMPFKNALRGGTATPPVMPNLRGGVLTLLYPDMTPISVNSALESSLQRIPVAPFSAFDCFSLHTRRSDQYIAANSGGIQHLGWGSSGPHTVPGAPMVLRNQSVDLWFDDRVTFTYHSTIGVGANAPAIKAGEWQICCHQGAAYGLDEGGWFSRAMALFSALPPFLLDSAGRPIMSYGFGPANSVAVLYWRLLWSAEVTTPGIAARLIDRTTYLSHVHAARDL